MPPAGYKNAVFLANEVPGVDIPQEVIDALKDKPQEQAFEISCNFAMSVIERVFDSAYGFYLMTPLRKWQLTSKLTALIRQQEQKSREKQK
jgi:homocysteine S-methyltransferase